MTKIVLAMLLGAVCASAWWAAARWHGLGDGVLYAVAVILSIPVIGIFITESVEARDV